MNKKESVSNTIYEQPGIQRLTWQRCEGPGDQATFHEVINDINDGIKRIETHSDLQTRARLVEVGEKVKEAIVKSSA